SAVDPGFFDYAIADSIGTIAAYRELRRQVIVLADRYAGADVWPDAGDRFGLLSEAIQVKKAIALASIERNGMHVDLARVRAGEADLRRRLDAAVANVRELCPELYKTDKDGNLRRTETGAPSKSSNVLVSQLITVQAAIEADTGVSLPVPLTAKTKAPS